MSRSQTSRPEGPHPLIHRRCHPWMLSGITGTFAKGPKPAAIPVSEVRYPCITDPSATDRSLSYPNKRPVQLACLSHAASVRSEPGSNSSIKYRGFGGPTPKRRPPLRSIKELASPVRTGPDDHSRLSRLSAYENVRYHLGQSRGNTPRLPNRSWQEGSKD